MVFVVLLGIVQHGNATVEKCAYTEKQNLNSNEKPYAKYEYKGNENESALFPFSCQLVSFAAIVSVNREMWPALITAARDTTYQYTASNYCWDDIQHNIVNYQDNYLSR